jgi:CIC family chloride channel protein
VGYESITEALFGSLSLKIVFTLLLMKCLATIITLGSGGSGGIFAPSLYMGAMLGASFGIFIENIFPSITIPAGAFALVGMAAFFSGAAHSPITAIMILFEMTGDYNIILPLMLATVLSTIISRMLSKESIYTLKLTRRGVHLESGTDIDVMQGITVGEVMDNDICPVGLSLGLKELTEKLYRDHKNGFIVLDDKGKLFGVATLSDLEKVLPSGSQEDKTVADIATREGLIVTYADEPMWKALKLLVRHDVSTLPVVLREDPQEVIGLIGRGNIVRAYRHAIAKRAEYQNKAELLKLGKLNEANFSKVEIPASSPLVGKQIRNINLPESSLIVSIRRKNSRKLTVAHGYTPIREGDQLIIFAEDKSIELVNNLLTGKAIKNITEGNVLYKDILIQAGSSCSGKLIQDLNIPLSCIIVSIKRGEKTIIPHGNTRVEADDIIQVYGLLPEINLIDSCFK